MKERDELVGLLEAALDAKGLRNDKYIKRLNLELKELDVLEEHEYFLKLYKEGKKYPENENNLLVPYLLDLCPDFDINKEPAYNQGEFPDIDMDYLPAIRDYLKNEWAVKEYGRDYVCSIGTYGTLGIKAAMLDMARVHGVPKDEVQMVTKQIEDKDDEGEPMEWDKALELYADFKSFCERYPDVASAAKMMLGRNKSGGVHAGGLIISSKPIQDFVPLEVRSVKKENKHGVLVSAWCEGQATQDLQPVGLVKFDLLVVDGLMQIAQACELIRQRHGIEWINALPGGRNWSDTSYLNDPKALAMADKADLKCIFQFGSEGIRAMVKRGGVTSFDDLMAYSALYRPGPLNMGMDKHYCNRKKGVEAWSIHPLLMPILGRTYGVLIYQEQCMQVLHTVGRIPLIHCEKVRKAISKKKIALFAKYKDMFITNGQKVLGETEKFVRDLWNQIEAFADYGFNASITIRTLVTSVDKNNNLIKKEVQNFVPGDRVLSVNDMGDTVISEVVQLHDHGEIYGYEVVFDDGYSVVCSMDHKFLTELGQKSLRDIIGSKLSVLCDDKNDISYAKEGERRLGDSMRDDSAEQVKVLRAQQELCEVSGESVYDRSDEVGGVGLGAWYAHVADTGRLVRRRVVRVMPVGKRRMYDLEVAINTHNFLLPNGVVTSNSHSCAYTYISARQLWLKAHYPLEYYTAVLMCEDQSDKIKEIKQDAKKHGIEVKPVHINYSRELFSIVGNDIYYGFSNLKKVGEAVAKRIVAKQPYTSFEDFLQRFGTDMQVLKPLISLGVFEEKVDRLTLYKFYDKFQDWTKKCKGRDKRFEGSQAKYETELRALLKKYGADEKEVEALARFDDDVISEWEARFGNIKVTQEYKYKGEIRTREVSVVKFLTDIHVRRNKGVRGQEEKVRLDLEEPPTLATFNPKTRPLEKEIIELLSDEKVAEQEYYGFQWVHDLEESPDYEGFTIDRFTEVVANRKEPRGAIEIKVLQVTKREFKTGTVAYDVKVEDANGKVVIVRFWSDDYTRFQDEIKPGALLRLHVKPPEGFPSYSFWAPPKHLRHKLVPKDKSHDERLYVLTPGKKKVVVEEDKPEAGFELM
jgi:hypothetical protein